MRTLSWYLEAQGSSNVAASGNTVFDMLQDAKATVGVNAFNGATVTRIIGDIYWRANDVPSLDNVQEVSYGIGVFPDSMSVGNHPNPRSDNYDWMWQKTILWVPWTVESSAGNFRQLIQVVHFDVLTQRRLKGTEARLELDIHNSGGESLSADLRCRTLVRNA